MFIINTDKKEFTDNISRKDLETMEANLGKCFTTGPKAKWFILMFLGGHGMLKEGQ